MKPILQALLIADRVYTDKNTNKKIIVGTFDRVFTGSMQIPTQKLPDGTPQMLLPGGIDSGCPAIYISLTDVRNEITITLQLVNVSKNKVITGIDIKVTCPDPLATVEIDIPLPPLNRIIQEEGVFSVDVLCDGEIIGSHRIVSVPIPTLPPLSGKEGEVP